MRYELAHAVHEPADAERGNRRAHEGKREYGADVAEKVAFLHGVAGVEDDGRQEDVKEDFRVENGLFVDFALLCVFDLALKPGMKIVLLFVVSIRALIDSFSKKCDLLCVQLLVTHFIIGRCFTNIYNIYSSLSLL